MFLDFNWDLISCLPEPHQWKVSSIGHGWSLAMASPSVLVPCPTWDSSDHTLLQLPIWSICNLPNLILRIDASSIILIWLLAWSFQMISLKSSTIARNLSWYFPQNGGFLKWWEPPHHPKLDHFSIEIHGDKRGSQVQLENFAQPGNKLTATPPLLQRACNEGLGHSWKTWKNGEFDQQSLDKAISVCFPRTGKLNWTIVDLGWYGFSLAIPLLGPWTKRCEPYQTPSFVHTKLWFQRHQRAKTFGRPQVVNPININHTQCSHSGILKGQKSVSLLGGVPHWHAVR